MTRPAAPTTAEIEHVGQLLAKYWGASARVPLGPFLNGNSPWDGALRTVRTLIQQMLQDPNRGHKLPISARQQVLEFGAKYGTVTRSAGGAEAREHRQTLRWGRGEWQQVEAAADAAGMTASDYVRGAALMAAQREKRDSDG